MTRGHSSKKSLKASFRKSLTQDCSFSNLPPPYHHNPLTATVMDCIAEIGMDPQGVQKCVAVSAIFQIISIMTKLRYSLSIVLAWGWSEWPAMVTNYDGFDVLDNDQCSGRDRNSERLLRLYLLGDGVSWVGMPLCLKKNLSRAKFPSKL